MLIEVMCAQTEQALKFCPSHEPGKYPHINVEGQGGVYFADQSAKDVWMAQHLQAVDGHYVVNRDGAYVPRLSAVS